MFNAKNAPRGMILAIAVALLAGGCSPKPSDTTSTETTSTSGGNAGTNDKVKIAFIVKQPEEPWFQLEWKFAKEAAAKDGFELIPLAATDSGQVLPKIESAAAQGAQGLIICSPDVRLGPAIVAKTTQRNMKLMSVDDQLIDDQGKPLDVHHLGISATKIGTALGQALWDEMQKRGWKTDDTAMILVTRDELDTAKQRTDGEAAALVKNGFPAVKIYHAPEKTTDIPGSRDAATVVLTQHPTVKHWLIGAMNDSGAIGAVRATETFNIKAADVIGIGINGDQALEDLKKPEPTGLYGSILLQARRHGYDTAEAMYKWIKDGTEPPKITYTDGILITRDNFRQVLKDQGLPEP